MPRIGEKSVSEKRPKQSVPERLPERSQPYAARRGRALNSTPILWPRGTNIAALVAKIQTRAIPFRVAGASW
jgi:hypothetical protein